MSCGVDEVRRQHRADDLDFVTEAFRPERPDGPVDHPRGENGALGGASFPLEETAGNLPGGVHALLDVYGEREEVRALARLHPALGRREHHCVARADEHGAIGLLGQLSGLEHELLPADGHRDRRLAFTHNTHFVLHFFWRVEV